MSLNAGRKAEIIKSYATKKGDTGSPEVQVAILSERINTLTEHFKSHVKDNPSFKKIRRRPGDNQKGSYFGDGEVVMGEGRPDTSADYELANDDELKNIDPNCTPKPGPTPKFFNWNTLHEVGHAVDDKKGFMKKNGATPDYGGWKSHSGDVTVVANAADGKFAGVTADMIA